MTQPAPAPRHPATDPGPVDDPIYLALCEECGWRYMPQER